MKLDILSIVMIVMIVIFYFVAILLLASEVKLVNGHCDKDSSIDYIVSTDWFCEMKDSL